jgi:hypothetical protein
MRSRLLGIGVSVLVLAALAVGGVALATTGDDLPVAGPEAERAGAAALAHVGGGRVTGIERETDDGAAWEVEVTRPSGSVDVKLDAEYRVLSVDGDTESEDDPGATDDDANDQETDPGEPPDDTAEDEPGDQETDADEPGDDANEPADDDDEDEPGDQETDADEPGDDANEPADDDDEDDHESAATRSLQAVGPFAPSRFSTKIDNPYVALSSVRNSVLQGHEGEAKFRSEARLLARKTRILGIPVAIVEVKDFEDGKLIERTLDYYAQRDDGSVWYFGEHVDDIEDGKVTGHDGQWIAGKSGAKPGLFMPAKPRVGQTFEQEQAPGVAEDRSTVVATGLSVKTPAGRFTGCIKTRDFAPLDKNTEFKIYCRNVGLVRQQAPDTLVQLVRYS